jgi:integrase
LLACTGLRVSEAHRLLFEDITPDGLIIRETKFRKSRLVPLHETAQAGLERYLVRRRRVAGDDDHVFVSLRGRALQTCSVDAAFQTAVQALETHPESPPATALSSFGGPNAELKRSPKVQKNPLTYIVSMILHRHD